MSENEYPQSDNGPQDKDEIIAQQPEAEPESEPEQPRRHEKLPKRRAKGRRNPFVVLLSGLFSLLFLSVLVGGGVLYVGKVWFEKPGPLEEAKTVVIPRGQGVRGITDQLKREGVINKSGFIDDAWVFYGAVLLYKAQDKLQAGEYAFEPGASMHDIMDKLSSGKAILHSLTIPEGLTSKQVIALVNAHEMLSGNEIVDVPAEGSLLPETYKFGRGTPRDQIVNRMRADLNKALELAWQNRDPELPLKNSAELLTLASIVEKETGVAVERPRVASVFVNRLRKGMKLQSDPTILYGLYGGDAWGMPRTIKKSELEAPNPYNTYQIERLPPGPIANVGVAALEAVSRPADTKDLFFVADGTGGHVFAETLDEHNKNVAKWREVEKSRKQDAAASEGTQTQ